MNSSEQNAFKATEQIISKASEQIASLKGLLKGKGEVEDSLMVINHAKALIPQIKKCMEQFTEIVNMPPYTFFEIRMRIQNSKDNSFLRWRENKNELMGVQVWEKAILNPPNTSIESVTSWLENLAYFEEARLNLNRYMSYLSFLIKQHKEYLRNREYTHSMLIRAKQSLSTRDNI